MIVVSDHEHIFYDFDDLIHVAQSKESWMFLRQIFMIWNWQTIMRINSEEKMMIIMRKKWIYLVQEARKSLMFLRQRNCASAGRWFTWWWWWGQWPKEGKGGIEDNWKWEWEFLTEKALTSVFHFHCRNANTNRQTELNVKVWSEKCEIKYLNVSRLKVKVLRSNSFDKSKSDHFYFFKKWIFLFSQKWKWIFLFSQKVKVNIKWHQEKWKWISKKIIQSNLESEHLKPVSCPRWKGQSYEVYDRGGRHLSKHKLDLALLHPARISW